MLERDTEFPLGVFGVQKNQTATETICIRMMVILCLLLGVDVKRF